MRRRPTLVIAATLAALFAVGVAGAIFAYRYAKRTIKQTIVEKREETVDLGALVTKVQELSRLETAAMHVVHVSTIKQSYGVIPDAIAGDELTLFAGGDVIAGLDLSRIKQNDVWREADGTIVLRLPPPQILVTRVDNRETKVISRKTGMLRKSDIHLESRARQYAESGIRNEAVNKGILEQASDNGEKKMADFLRVLGFERVRFEQPGGTMNVER